MFYHDVLLWVSVRKKDQQPHTSLQVKIQYILCVMTKQPHNFLLLLLTFTGQRDKKVP